MTVAIETTWAYYERLAANYDQRIRAVLPGYDLMQEILVDHMCTLLGDAAHVIVIGAGTGNELLRLGRLRPGWQLLGVEPSNAMACVAQKKIECANISNVTLIRSSVFDVEPIVTFDACSLSLVMQLFNVAGKVRLLQHAYRLLTANALLVLFDTCCRDSEAEFSIDLEAMSNHNSRNGLDAQDSANNAATLADRFQLISAEHTEKLLAEAGSTEFNRYSEFL